MEAKRLQPIDNPKDAEELEDAALDRMDDEYYFGRQSDLYEKGLIQPEDI